MFIRKNKIIIIILQPVDGATDGATRRVICPASIYTISLSVCLSVCLSQLANCRSQFLLDRLGRCLKLFISAESTSCHELASQFGLELFYAKNTQNLGETGPPVSVFISMASDQPLSPVERAVTVGCHRPIE